MVEIVNPSVGYAGFNSVLERNSPRRKITTKTYSDQCDPLGINFRQFDCIIDYWAYHTLPVVAVRDFLFADKFALSGPFEKKAIETPLQGKYGKFKIEFLGCAIKTGMDNEQWALLF